jgi:hypothetical protein
MKKSILQVRLSNNHSEFNEEPNFLTILFLFGDGVEELYYLFAISC